MNCNLLSVKELSVYNEKDKLAMVSRSVADFLVKRNYSLITKNYSLSHRFVASDRVIYSPSKKRIY